MDDQILTTHLVHLWEYEVDEEPIEVWIEKIGKEFGTGWRYRIVVPASQAVDNEAYTVTSEPMYGTPSGATIAALVNPECGLDPF